MNENPITASSLRSGDRRVLSRAITLAESKRPDDRGALIKLLEDLNASDPNLGLRIALSGAPGVGKSTFIDRFGLMLIEIGLSVAVVAVDPSSLRSGGSILGDKTRMDRLAREPSAYIRPSPIGGDLGGIARSTKDAIYLCEQAGFNVILVETTGVGQSESIAAESTDIFALLIQPAAGDELQGIKRGIMEEADILLVNKADGELVKAAKATCANHSSALRLFRKRDSDPEEFPKAMTVSAETGTGFSEVWSEITTLAEWRKSRGHFLAKRRRQELYWFRSDAREEILSILERDSAIGALTDKLESRIVSGEISRHRAVRMIMDAMGKREIFEPAK